MYSQIKKVLLKKTFIKKFILDKNTVIFGYTYFPKINKYLNKWSSSLKSEWAKVIKQHQKKHKILLFQDQIMI